MKFENKNYLIGISFNFNNKVNKIRCWNEKEIIIIIILGNSSCTGSRRLVLL